MRSSLVSRGIVAVVALALGADAQQSAPALAPVGGGAVPFGAACADSSVRERVSVGVLQPATATSGFPLVFPLTRVIANGGSLRNASSTGIDLMGIAPGGTVVAAYLYWTWISLNVPMPGLHDTMILGRVPRAVASLAGPGPGTGLSFNIRATSVTGTLVGVGLDPCWSGGSNFVYRADVTALVDRGDTYLVWAPAGAAGTRNYTDPWALPPVPPLCEGASLVAVYTHPLEPMGTTYIYDSGLAGNMFYGSPGITYFLGGFFHPGFEARWIDIGADGQSGAGYQELHAMGLETSFFNGFSLAGPGSLTDSDWNGSANRPLGLLWDTSGHDVSPYLPLGATSVNVQVIAPPPFVITDCLVPVCNVLWMR